MNLSSDVPETALRERIAAQAVNTCCSLIYTVSTPQFQNKRHEKSTDPL